MSEPAAQILHEWSIQGPPACEQELIDLAERLRTLWPDPALKTLRTERDELKRALEAIQWGSCDGCGNHHCCPACKATRYDCESDDPDAPGHHKLDCPVGCALGGQP